MMFPPPRRPAAPPPSPERTRPHHAARPVPVEAGDGLSASMGTDGLEIRLTLPRPLWAKITGQAAGTNRYAWTQIDEGDTAAFDAGLSADFAASGDSDAAGGPAYEVNGNVYVAVGTRVKLWPAGDLSYYLFAHCCRGDADAPPPGPPTSVTTTPGFNALSVNWTAPAGVPPAANYVIWISTSNTFAPNNTFAATVAAPATNYTFSNLSSTVIGSSFNNLYVAIQAVSANNTFSSWVTVTEPRPIPNLLVVNAAGTTLTVGWSSNVTFGSGAITITGTQSTNATFSSGSGTPNTTFNLGATILQGSTVTCSLPANLVDDGSGNNSVLTSGATATNNSTVTGVPV